MSDDMDVMLFGVKRSDSASTAGVDVLELWYAGVTRFLAMSIAVRLVGTKSSNFFRDGTRFLIAC